MDIPSQHRTLKRELGLWGAVLLGLGSIIGTGIFVSLALATEIAGSGVLISLVIAALLAAANGLSSAQLAASHPVSGGTYEYGYKYLNPWLGWTAGWLFVCAKTASAATAALGIVAYASLFSLQARSAPSLGALLIVVVVGLTVLSGLRSSSRLNAVMVLITLTSLLIFVVAGTINLPWSYLRDFPHLVDRGGWPGILHAAALLFVAYTGYGRVATLGEEVRNPRDLIPRAIIVTLAISLIIYLAVGFVAVSFEFILASLQDLPEHGFLGPPLAGIASVFADSWLPTVVSIGALTAMLGVLLNLILGVSRVVLAMGRRGDLPTLFAKVNTSGTAPTAAVLFTMLVIAALALTGNIKLTWSFSALTVLFYYAVTNACALAMPAEQRIFPRWIAWAGLLGCLALVAYIEPHTWLLGAIVVAVGLLWRLLWLGSRPQKSVQPDPKVDF